MPKCRWYSKSLYFKLKVFPMHLDQQLNVKKYSGITVNLITSGSLYCVHFFPCGQYLQCVIHIAILVSKQKYAETIDSL